jgi:hypothetical protein
MPRDARHSTHLLTLSNNQADAASYICELTRSLSTLASQERLFFVAELLQIAGDAAWDASATRTALMTRMQAIGAARAAEEIKHATSGT